MRPCLAGVVVDGQRIKSMHKNDAAMLVKCGDGVNSTNSIFRLDTDAPLVLLAPCLVVASSPLFLLGVVVTSLGMGSALDFPFPAEDPPFPTDGFPFANVESLFS